MTQASSRDAQASRYVRMAMLFLRMVASVSSNCVGGPFGNSTSWALPLPTKSGWIQSRNSSRRPCSMSSVETAPNPYWTMSWPGSSFSCRIRSATSPAITVVFAHSGSVSVVETTYLVIVFMRSDKGSPERVCQTGAKPSWVRLPISTASQASQQARLELAAALVGRALDRRPLMWQLDDAVQRDVGRVDD